MELLRAFVKAIRALKVGDVAQTIGVAPQTIRRWKGYVKAGVLERPLSPRNRAVIEDYLGEQITSAAAESSDFAEGVTHATDVIMRAVNGLRERYGIAPYSPAPLRVHVRPASDARDSEQGRGARET